LRTLARAAVPAPESTKNVATEPKIRRKDLRQPDEFVTLSRQALEWTEKNRTAVIGGAVAAVLLLVAIVVYSALAASRTEAAAKAYQAAHVLFADGKFAEAATAFESVASQYGGTSYGPLAQLELGHALLRAGRAAEAIPAYQKFLDGSAPAEWLRQSALTGLARATEKNGDLTAARSHYAAAATAPGPYADAALLGEAHTADAAGDAARARDLYVQFLEKYPTSDLRPVAALRLARLGGTPPAAAADDDGSGEDVAAN
jgi:predicted negative regulator of RcsB-dependent stress response